MEEELREARRSSGSGWRVSHVGPECRRRFVEGQIREAVPERSLASVLFHSSVSASKYKSFPAKQFFAGSSVIGFTIRAVLLKKMQLNHEIVDVPPALHENRTAPTFPAVFEFNRRLDGLRLPSIPSQSRAPLQLLSPSEFPSSNPTFDCIHPSGRCMKCVVAIESEDADFEKFVLVTSRCEGVMQESEPTQQHKSTNRIWSSETERERRVSQKSNRQSCDRPAAVAEHSINEQARTVNDPTSFHQSAPPCSDVVAEVHQQLMKVWRPRGKCGSWMDWLFEVVSTAFEKHAEIVV
ncbi:hypothetical protein BLNAU_21710 [Blattamonas nauphoetae]|uniref:Uncharacterized protein n=1 Tax=Blattamonas nauphoetae TaxID=2049346 RepID=A0ABQ9WV91_9EUKA|nr:hypothetical protein BLNAU_21710 [Blattamonas nauphoetae]